MHTGCSCPNCVGIILSDYYVTAPWLFEERQWTDNRQGKPRRIALIRSVWHLSQDSELAYQIHTVWHGQRSVSYEAARNSRRKHPLQTGEGTTQESLSLLD
jgi:hypothetical protein